MLAHYWADERLTIDRTLGVLVLDERLGMNSLAGLGVIILGVWIVNGGGSWLAARVRGLGMYSTAD